MKYFFSHASPVISKGKKAATLVGGNTYVECVEPKDMVRVIGFFNNRDEIGIAVRGFYGDGGLRWMCK